MGVALALVRKHANQTSQQFVPFMCGVYRVCVFTYSFSRGSSIACVAAMQMLQTGRCMLCRLHNSTHVQQCS